jgi:hypothetical protein
LLRPCCIRSIRPSASPVHRFGEVSSARRGLTCSSIPVFSTFSLFYPSGSVGLGCGQRYDVHFMKTMFGQYNLAGRSVWPRMTRPRARTCPRQSSGRWRRVHGCMVHAVLPALPDAKILLGAKHRCRWDWKGMRGTSSSPLH